MGKRERSVIPPDYESDVDYYCGGCGVYVGKAHNPIQPDDPQYALPVIDCPQCGSWYGSDRAWHPPVSGSRCGRPTKEERRRKRDAVQ